MKRISFIQEKKTGTITVVFFPEETHQGTTTPTQGSPGGRRTRGDGCRSKDDYLYDKHNKILWSDKTLILLTYKHSASWRPKNERPKPPD